MTTVKGNCVEVKPLDPKQARNLIEIGKLEETVIAITPDPDAIVKWLEFGMMSEEEHANIAIDVNTIQPDWYTEATQQLFPERIS